ncbi:MAG TPA: ABC transporter substrate-binding protein, partial [Thermomicrobiales bacterium]|nr:ABC transporter substrate-binding protein [Thermomicrobiales bacterium]
MVDDRQVALTQQIMNLYQSQGVDRRHFLKMLAAVGGGTALSALLAACGGDDDDDDTDSSTGDDDAPAPTSNDSGADEASDDEADDEASDDGDTDETPAETSSGGATHKILIAGYNQDISNLDPHTGHDYSIATTQKSCYDTLLRYRGNPPQLVPLLATEYESNDDATEWTFKLDERAVFHDGTPVTASDVVYSVGRMIRKNRGVAWLFSNVMDEDGAEAVDDHTV